MVTVIAFLVLVLVAALVAKIPTKETRRLDREFAEFERRYAHRA